VDANGSAEPVYWQAAGLDHPPKVPDARPRPVRGLLHSEQPDFLRSGGGCHALVKALALPREPFHRLPPLRS